MKKLRLLLAGIATTMTGLLALPAMAGAVASTVVYNAVPNPLPPNVASLGFEATSTSEFGDYVHLAGSDRNLKTVTVTMSDWALNADYPSMPATGWSHSITLNVYSVVPGTTNTKGSLLGSRTQAFTIPWRPAEDPINCPTKDNAGYDYKWQSTPGLADTNCSNGFAFNLAFDLSSANITLPNNVIFSVAYNTQTYGFTPLGVAGPYNSLNVGIPTNNLVSVGSDDSTDKTFWDTTYPGYTSGLKEDSGWSPNGTVAFKVEASAPLVGPATNKDQCKGDGWKTFNNPAYKNQGDCVSAVASNGKAKGNPVLANNPTF